MTPYELKVLIDLSESRISYVTVDPEDDEMHKALHTLSEEKYIDPYNITDPVTSKGKDKIFSAVSEGINYDRHFKKASIKAKRAAFLALMNSGYEPRGLMKFFVSKLSQPTFGQLNRAYEKRSKSRSL